jgi:hypothetical protein
MEPTDNVEALELDLAQPDQLVEAIAAFWEDWYKRYEDDEAFDPDWGETGVLEYPFAYVLLLGEELLDIIFADIQINYNYSKLEEYTVYLDIDPKGYCKPTKYQLLEETGMEGNLVNILTHLTFEGLNLITAKRG